MSALSVFLPQVRPFAPGVPDLAAENFIRQAAIDFCERTRLWRYEDTFDVTAEDCDEIATPYGSVLHDIEIVLFNGKELHPKATRDLDRLSPGWRDPAASASTGLPMYYTQIESNTLKIVPPMAGTLYLCLRLKPDPEAQDLPDFLAQEYRECIGWGALGKLLLTPNQSYTSPDLAQFYETKFDQKIDRLNTKGTTGQQNAPKRTRSRYF